MFLYFYIIVSLSIFTALVIYEKIYRISTGALVLFFIFLCGAVSDSIISNGINNELFTCSKSKNICEYKTSTLTQQQLITQRKFPLSSISGLSTEIKKRTLTRKGRYRTYYQYINVIHFKDKSDIDYPIRAENEEEMKNIDNQFSLYLRNKTEIYKDENKGLSNGKLLLCFVFFIILSFLAITKQKKEEKTTNEPLTTAKNFINTPPTREIITTNFFDIEWWKTAQIEDVEAEIAKGGSVKERDDDGYTPLMCAVTQSPYPEVIKILVSLGANINERDYKYGYTPLMYAVGNNINPEIIKTLIELGADINEVYDHGHTPLMQAAEENENPEIIKILVKLGARVNERDVFDNTPLMHAAEGNENPNIIKMLVALGANIDECDRYQERTALMYAAESNENPEIIKVLVELEADINARDRYGKTPLMYAIEWNENPEIIKTLIELGADIKERDYAGNTVLMYAEKGNKSLDIINLLTK